MGNYATPWTTGLHDDPAVARTITRLVSQHRDGASWDELARDFGMPGSDLHQAIRTFLNQATEDDNDHLWPVYIAYVRHLPCTACR